MQEGHPNSKKITIFRSGSFLSRAQGDDIQHHFADAKVSVGSYYESRNSQKIATGLSMSEEALLLPSIIDLPKDDKEFRKKLADFYKDIDTKVPAETGCILEVGLEVDNSKPVSETNLPIALMDYLRYRHAKGHPFMGATKEEAVGNALKQYYIFDPESIQSKNKNKSKARDIALQIYLTLKADLNKVDMMLTLLNVDPREFTGKDKDEDKVEALKAKSDSDPEKFAQVYNEENFETKYWIQSMVNTEVIKLLGGKYYNAETNKMIGNSLEETIAFFNDDEHTEDIIILKGMYQEASKKALKKTNTKTKALAGKHLKNAI